MGWTTIDGKELLAQFKTHLLESGLAPATVVNYLADLRAFLRWIERTKGGQVSAFDLEGSDVRAFCSFLQEDRSHAPATINRRLQALRKFYNLAVAQGWTSRNPADEVALLSETVSQRSRFMTEDDVTRLRTAVRQGHRRWADRDWAIIEAFLGAGLKLSELTDLRLVDVHLDSSEPHLVVRGTERVDLSPEPSSGPTVPGGSIADRTIPLDAEACAALRRYVPNRRAAEGVEHFFINRDGNPLSTRSVQRLLRHYARAADLDDLTTQALRYIYARNAYEICHNPETVARLLGHRHLATTVRYLRPGSQAVAEPAEVDSQAEAVSGVDTADEAAFHDSACPGSQAREGYLEVS